MNLALRVRCDRFSLGTCARAQNGRGKRVTARATTLLGRIPSRVGPLGAHSLLGGRRAEYTYSYHSNGDYEDNAASLIRNIDVSLLETASI